MLKPVLIGCALSFFSAGATFAQSCTSTAYPYALTNGSTADANQVMANFNCAARTVGPLFTGNVGIAVTAPQTSLTVGSLSPGTSEPTYHGLVQIEGGADLTTGSNGLELKTSIYGSGFGWLITAPDRGSGNVPLSFASRNSAAAWTERMTVRSDSGYVGIGTANPSENLDVESTATTAAVKIGAATNPLIQYYSSSGGADQKLWDQYTSNTGWVFRAVNDAYTTATNWLVVNRGTGYQIGSVVFPSGNVGIGTVSSSYLFYVNGAAGGTMAWNSTSDGRLKKNVAPITDALSEVERLRGVRFEWRSPGERTVGKEINLPINEPQMGFIAQEVAAVAPEAVSAPVDPAKGVYAMRDGTLMALAIEAIKQQQAEIRRQQAEIDELRMSLEMLRKRN